MLCGHTDTVGLGQMSAPLVPAVDGDRLYARGAYDMKAGLAAALVAAREASRLGLAGEVVVAAVADEEHSSLGVQEVLRHVRTDAAIVTEPTELTVATAHRGFVWTEIEVVGIAAHGSRPHLGKDAILKTGPILVALADLNQRLRSRTHPRLGRGFVHGGLISGGREESTIPDSCVLTIERRTLPGETLDDVERDVADLLASCRTADPELEVHSRTTLARPPFEIDDSADFVGTVTAAVTTALGAPAGLAGVSYWADASLIAAAGIPTVLFGPPGDGAHAQVEWVSIAGTLDCTRGLLATARRFCA
jgi:acetylornithine deacetylase